MRERLEITRIMEDMSQCTGCGACASVCPVGAIEMIPDEEGFLFPVVDQERCTSCGRCVRVCPVNRADAAATGAARQKTDDSNGNDLPTYACWAVSASLRAESSSGGTFGVLATQVVKAAGVVFGAAFASPTRVIHQQAETVAQLQALLRSKYIQSETGNVFLEVKQQLDAGRRVLFCGTPCQVAGLYAFLGHRPDQLLSCDFVCSGVPSPLAWRLHVTSLEQRLGGAVRQVSFRSKRRGWRGYRLAMTFANGAGYDIAAKRDPFFIGFGKELFNRLSCANCRFRTRQSAADLTLADYWGIWKAGKENMAFRDNKGVSLVVVHTPAGRAALETVQDQLNQVRRTYGEAEANNPRMTTSRAPSPQRAAYFQAVADGLPYPQIQKKFMDNTSLRYHLKAFARFLLPVSWLQRIREKMR